MNIKLTTLAEKPHLFRDTIELIEEAFEYEDYNSFDVDFAPLVNKSNHKHNHILIDEDRVVGHIGVQLRSLSIANTPIVLIGGIAICKSFRGQGLFGKLLKDIINKYKDSCAMILLWSDLDSLYEKFGFYQAGGIIQTGSNLIKDAKIPLSYTKVNWEQLSPREFNEVKDLYLNNIENSYLTIQRSNADWTSIKKISSTDLYIKKKNDFICSYFLINKGQDLEDIIHELVYQKDIKKEILSELDSFQLWLPEIENDTYNKENISYCSFFKITNFKLFKDFFNKWSNGDIEILDVQYNFVRFNLKELLHELSHQDFLLSTFGPNPVEEFELMGKPLYICGVDSI